MKKFIDLKSAFISLVICVSVGYFASVLTDVPFVTATGITFAAVLINGFIIMISEK